MVQGGGSRRRRRHHSLAVELRANNTKRMSHGSGKCWNVTVYDGSGSNDCALTNTGAAK